MLLLPKQPVVEQMMAAAESWRLAHLSKWPGRRRFAQIIIPDDPHWVPSPQYWMVSRGGLFRAGAPFKLSEIDDEVLEAEFVEAMDVVHPILVTGAFFFVDQAGVYPPMPTDEDTLTRMGARPHRLVKDPPAEAVSIAEKLKARDIDDEVLTRGMWCFAQYSIYGGDPETRAKDDDYPHMVYVVYMRNGMELNSSACGMLYHLTKVMARQRMIIPISFLEDMTDAVCRLYESGRYYAGGIGKAWATVATAAAADLLARFLVLSDKPKPSEGRYSTLIARLSRRHRVSMDAWRLNTKARLDAVAAVIRQNARLIQIVELVEQLLSSDSKDDQRLASKGVEVLEFIAQARLAQLAVNHQSIWTP